MTVGGGEAADQLVRMMLSGTEVMVRLTGSALKNVLALTMALAKNNKTISGKINLKKMLRETRDLRQFPMTPEQFKKFRKLAKKQRLLYSAIHDRDDHGKLIDVILPVTELDRANLIFERMQYQMTARNENQQEQHVPEAAQRRESHPDRNRQQEQEVMPKKESRSERDSHDTKPKSSASREAGTRTMRNEKPSIERRLQVYQLQLEQRKPSVPAKIRNKIRPQER